MKWNQIETELDIEATFVAILIFMFCVRIWISNINWDSRVKKIVKLICIIEKEIGSSLKYSGGSRLPVDRIKHLLS